MALHEVLVPIHDELDWLDGTQILVRYAESLHDSADFNELVGDTKEYMCVGFVEYSGKWTIYFSAARYHDDLLKALELSNIQIGKFAYAQAFVSDRSRKITMMTVHSDLPYDMNEMRTILTSCFTAIAPELLVQTGVDIYGSDTHIAEYDVVQQKLFMTLPLAPKP